MMNVLHAPPVPDVPSVDDEARPSTASHEPWPRVKLGEVCEFVGGGTPSKSHPEYFDGGIPWVSVRDMTRKVIEKTERTISKLGLENSAANLIPKGSIIISTHVGLGKVCLLSCDAAINQDIKAVIPKTADLSVEFLYAYFLINADYLISQGTGSTVKGVKLSFVENLSIPLPPLPVQRSIVVRLDRELGAVEKVTKAFEELGLAAEGEFKAELKETFEEISRGGAETRRLGDVCEIVCGKTPLKTNPAYWLNGTVPWFTIDDLRMQGKEITKTVQNISELAASSMRVIPANTVLLCCTASIGACCICRIPLTTNQQFNALIAQRDVVSEGYLFHYCSGLTKTLLELSSRTTIDFVSKTKVEGIMLPLPSLPVQREIVVRLDAARERKDRLVSAAKRGREAAALWRKAILKEAFE